MSDLIGWTFVLIAVLLGLFLTDGPGAGANLRNVWFVSRVIPQVEMAVGVPADCGWKF
jgi:hypothetical protein